MEQMLSSNMIGERLQDTRFKVAARKEVINRVMASQDTLSAKQVENLYRCTMGSSEQRKFLVDLCVVNPSLVKLTPEYPAQFVLDLAQNLLSRQPVDRVSMRRALLKILPEAKDGDGVDEEDHGLDILAMIVSAAEDEDEHGI
jgi:hypothetical protein